MTEPDECGREEILVMLGTGGCFCFACDWLTPSRSTRSSAFARLSGFASPGTRRSVFAVERGSPLLSGDPAASGRISWGEWLLP